MTTRLQNLRRLPAVIAGSRRAQILTTVLVTLAVAGGLAPLALAKMNRLPDDAVFRLDDRVVTEADLEARVKVLGALYGIRRPTEGKKLDSFNRDAAKAMAVSLVIDEEADARGIAVSDKQLQQELQRLISNEYGEGGREEFVTALGQEGASEADVLDELERQRRIGELFAEVTKDAVGGVTDEFVRGYYRDHPDEMVSSPARRLRNVVVSTRAEALQIARQARAGSPFPQLARRHSLDESTRNDGGALGMVTPAMLDQSYARVAFSSRRGEVFGPVQTEHGWNVGQVLEVVPAQRLTFEEIAPRLKETLATDAAVSAWRDWLIELLRAAEVEYDEDYEPSDPLEPPGAAPTSPPLGGADADRERGE